METQHSPIDDIDHRHKRPRNEDQEEEKTDNDSTPLLSPEKRQKTEKPVIVITIVEDGWDESFIKRSGILSETEQFLLQVIEKEREDEKGFCTDAVEAIEIFRVRGGSKYRVKDDDRERIDDYNKVIQKISGVPDKYRIETVTDWEEIDGKEIAKITRDQHCRIYIHTCWC